MFILILNTAEKLAAGKKKFLGHWRPFDVPVEIKDANGEVAALVDIDDGIGQFSVDNRAGDISVYLDKEKHMILYKRAVRQVASANQLECTAAE